MNYISCIIQILEISTIELYEDNIPSIKFRVQLPYVRNKAQSATIIEAIIWGDLAYDISNYYRINDYALIEGYISIVFNNITSPPNNINNQGLITLNIVKLYPFLFSFDVGS